ncbi:Crp/Fnr family transcriptional regulator [Peribacillus castrilensis]|jgi:CRP/FNR family transcriptional regulator|uniref:Crp/Fnr family transcriptional regulator n=2 Tax=Peribacillus TaxID=2675229 RepID=A0AAJ1QKM8_9BACI|nr:MULTISPECIES: Crp/Fnr family transcriptional regulator [Bacillaceae]KRF60212.1 Crp/Fnr family transcriptional regulator [Bacillus sp. Soil745]MBT2603870.1 Crp/Fnr family transcriptional regulator [Bacillus sp. ISL-53]MCD1159846.1 Crp/Fnr family transcriptional regulator [Peribacillus castrilensis]MCP1093715.1 Crp/Fnr family transcriptional regulator [Bacillaceae bacterium OS4b]PRS40218.1 Crp/Fnr family transcriptional regulator [Bacillus sp. RJGP41]QNK50719.1 Crp/Fnr family transcriptional
MNELSLSNRMQAILDNKQQIKHMEKGRYLFHESTPASDLYYIINGKVEVSKVVPDGRELTIRISSENDLVGETVLFSQNPKYMMNAKMMEDGTVAVISKEALEEKIASDSHLAVEMMTWLSAQNRKNQAKFRDMLLHGKKGAFYSTLIRLSNSYGTEAEDGKVINLPFTNQELANFCGTSREVVNRMLAQLRKNNVISIKKGRITILDFDYLKQEIDCENCPIEICTID